MKIAITGHSSGIGKELASVLAGRGHEIIGLSRSNGFNIRNIPKLMDEIDHCDIFINNAQAGYSQTELLYEVWYKWINNHQKRIWCISTMLTQDDSIPQISGMDKFDIMVYKNQKQSLELACKQLNSLYSGPRITLIRPGAVATQPDQTATWPHCEPHVWAETVIDLLLLAESRNLNIAEFSLGTAKRKMNL